MVTSIFAHSEGVILNLDHGAWKFGPSPVTIADNGNCPTKAVSNVAFVNPFPFPGTWRQRSSSRWRAARRPHVRRSDSHVNPFSIQA